MIRVEQRKIGILLTYLGQVVQLLSGLFYTPVMLRLLGQNEYGLYTLVNSVVSYLGLLNFGFSGSYLRFYSRLKANNDTKEIARLNGMFISIFFIISLLCLLCGGAMIWNIESVFGNGLSLAEYRRARILMGLLVVNMSLNFPLSVFDSSIIAHEEFIFQRLVILIQHLLNPFISLPLLMLGYGSISLVCVTTVLSMLKIIVCIHFCKKRLGIQFLFEGFRFSLFKEMWTFTFFIFLNSVIDQINWNMDKLLIGRILGTVSVAIYGVAAQLNGMYLNFSTAVSNVFIPKVNRIVAKGNNVNYELTRLFVQVGRIQAIILMLIISGFVIFGRPFIYFWAGKYYEEAYETALLLMIPVTIPLIQNLGIEIQRAKNKHQVRSIIYLVMAVVNFGISIPFINSFGIRGAALGTAFSLVSGNIFFMNWYYNRYIGLDIFLFWKSIITFFPAFIIPFIFGKVLMKIANLYNPVHFTISIFIYIGVYSISVWKLGMNTEEKSMIALFSKRNIAKKQ